MVCRSFVRSVLCFPAHVFPASYKIFPPVPSPMVMAQLANKIPSKIFFGFLGVVQRLLGSTMEFLIGRVLTLFSPTLVSRSHDSTVCVCLARKQTQTVESWHFPYFVVPSFSLPLRLPIVYWSKRSTRRSRTNSSCPFTQVGCPAPVDLDAATHTNHSERADEIRLLAATKADDSKFSLWIRKILHIGGNANASTSSGNTTSTVG